MQLREYIDDTEDYINIQVGNVKLKTKVCILVYACFLKLNSCILFLQLDNHRNQLIQVLTIFSLWIVLGVWDPFSLTSKHTQHAYGLFMCFDLLFMLSFHFLLQLELFLSSGTVCLSIYSLVAGIFGMNIPYTWNDNHGYMFKWVGRILLLVNLAPGYKLLLFGESIFFFFFVLPRW
jgi:magnesium transporter